MQMDKNYVVDANIFGKLVLNEPDSSLADNFVCDAIQEESYFFVPTLFFYELIGLLKKNNIPVQDIREFISEVHDKPYMKPIDLHSKLLLKSLEISQVGNKKSGFPTFYDSVYHALAILNNCDFITADKKLYVKTRQLGNIRLLRDIDL